MEILRFSSWRAASLSKGYVFVSWYLVKYRVKFTFTGLTNYLTSAHILVSVLFGNSRSSQITDEGNTHKLASWSEARMDTHWDHGFESRSRNGYMSVLFCVDRGLEKCRSPI
jgi:hypothetical protein